MGVKQSLSQTEHLHMPMFLQHAQRCTEVDLGPGSAVGHTKWDPAVGTTSCICLRMPFNTWTQEHVLSAASHHHNNDLNIYEGRRIQGYVETTISSTPSAIQIYPLNIININFPVEGIGGRLNSSGFQPSFVLTLCAVVWEGTYGGRVVWQHGQLNVEPGSGRFVPLPLHGPLFDGLPKPGSARQESGFCRTSDPV
eukprot:1149232-Pelagomonas_calceolata.AAC.4